MQAITATQGEPDKLALLYVQQWLHENGYIEALEALERKCGLLYDDTKLEHSSQLAQLVWRHMEDELACDVPEEGSMQAQIAAEDEAMLRGGKGDYPQTVSHSIQGIHTSSIVCVRIVPGRDEVITGSGDGTVHRVTFGGQVVWSTPVGSGGVLCLDLHPSTRCGTPGAQPDSPPTSPSSVSRLMAVGTMDGAVTIMDSQDGAVLAVQRAHLKYVVRVAWANDGRHLVSCSHDHTLDIHVVETLDSTDGGAPTVTFTTTRKVQFLTSVQDATFLRDGSLVVALRDTCFLRVMTLDTLEARERQVNLNASGDTHVSFFARHLAPSPCGRFLLVCTDTGRNLVLRTRNWELARYALHSPPTEQFHQFCAAWHRDSHYIFSGAPGAQVWVTHVGSGKVVQKLAIHSVNVRDLDYDPERNLLATSSFDKTVKLLTYDPVGAADMSRP